MIELPDTDPLVSYLTTELADYAPLEEALIENIAFAVRYFLTNEQTPEPYPSELLAILSARALNALGYRSNAMEFLHAQIPDPKKQALFRPFILSERFDRRIWNLIQADVLSHYDGMMKDQRRASWVLDLSRVPRGHDVLDLTIYLSLRKLLEMFGPVWEAESGDFCLHFRGLPRQNGPDEPSATQLMDYMRNLMQDMAVRAGWMQHPELLSLDLSIHLS